MSREMKKYYLDHSSIEDLVHGCIRAANGHRHQGDFGGELLRAPGDSSSGGPSAFRAGTLHPSQDIEGMLSLTPVAGTDGPFLHVATVGSVA